MATRFFDALETRDPEQRERELLAALPGQIANAKKKGPGWARILGDVAPDAVTDRASLAALPVTRKSDLAAMQAESPPLGGLATEGAGGLSWIFASPGPIFEPGMRDGDFWRMGRAMFAAGFRAGDIAYNTFAYHLTPAGHMMEAGAHAVGCTVVPGGVGNTDIQLQVIAHIKPEAYLGTPSFLRILLEKATETGAGLPFTKASVGGEALPPSLRAAFAKQGIDVLQSYGTADIGLIAYESKTADGATEGLILDEGVILEIVRPGSDEPVADGEVGEVVVTSLNPVYPLIRFGTGDLSAVLAGTSPCGRTNTRIKGWMGRADQTAKVRGMFVHPSQVARIAARHDAVVRARLVLTNPDHTDTMVLECETEAVGDDALVKAVEDSIQAECKLRGSAKLVAVGSLPNDGKVIDDQRRFE